MNKLIYLSNGQQAELRQELPNNQYLVDPIFSYEDYNSGEWYDLPSQGLRIVDKIFNKPPIEKISKEVSELLEQKILLTTENSKVKQDTLTAKTTLQQLESKVQDISKWQIDLSKWRNCKTIHFFLDGIIQPISINKPKYSSDYYKLQWTVSAGKDTELSFNLVVMSDGYSDRNSKVDESYGYMFDLTQDEVDSIALERLEKLDLSHYKNSYQFRDVPERFKTERVMEHYNSILKEEHAKNKTHYEKQILELQEKLKSIS